MTFLNSLETFFARLGNDGKVISSQLPPSGGSGGSALGTWARVGVVTGATLTPGTPFHNVAPAEMTILEQSTDNNFSIDPVHGLVTAKAGWFTVGGAAISPSVPPVVLDAGSTDLRWLWIYGSIALTGSPGPFASIGFDAYVPIGGVPNNNVAQSFVAVPNMVDAGAKVTQLGFAFSTAGAADSLPNPEQSLGLSGAFGFVVWQAA